MDPLTKLLLDAKRGRSGAMERFVEATYASVHRLCLHLVGPDDAEDATQESYVALWRSLSSYRGDSSARTWLLLIARHEAERIGRRRDRWRSLAQISPAPRGSSPVETRSELVELLALLDDERRAAFVLTQFLGLSYSETAEICECPVGTVRSRVARAREQLLQMARASEAFELPG